MITTSLWYFVSELAGYNAARADFESEHDNLAELGLNNIEIDETMYEYLERYNEGRGRQPHFTDENEEGDKLLAALSVTMLDVYKNKLKARTRRKRYSTVSGN